LTLPALVGKGSNGYICVLVSTQALLASARDQAARGQG